MIPALGLVGEALPALLSPTELGVAVCKLLHPGLRTKGECQEGMGMAPTPPCKTPGTPGSWSSPSLLCDQPVPGCFVALQPVGWQGLVQNTDAAQSPSFPQPLGWVLPPPLHQGGLEPLRGNQSLAARRGLNPLHPVGAANLHIHESACWHVLSWGMLGWGWRGCGAEAGSDSGCVPWPGVPCPFRHVGGEKTVVCKHWLRGLCKKGDGCDFLHEYDVTKLPDCYFYSKFGRFGMGQGASPTPAPMSLGSGLEQEPDATSCLREETLLAPTQGHSSLSQAWVLPGHLGSSHPAHP